MTEYEPPRITQSESAHSWSNGELKDAFDPLVTTNTNDAVNNYVTMVNKWQEGVETFLRSINRSISEAWEGASADAAKTAIGNYCTAAQNLTGPLQELATGMAECAAGVDRTKNSIPDPVVVTWTSWLNPVHRHTLTTRQSEHQNEAREAFTTHYVNPFGEIDKKIPVLPAPSGLDISKNVSGGSDTSNGGGTPGHSGTDGSGVGSGTGSQSGSTSSSSDSGVGTGSSSDGSGSSGTSSGSPSSSNAVTPSGYTPSSGSTATTPSGYTPGSGTPGLHGTGTGIGTDSPGGTRNGGPGQSGVPGGTFGGPGRSIPGTLSPAAARAAAAAARGVSGAPGMGGMGNSGSKGKGDEDGEHQSPDYLVTMENTRELLGDEPRTIPGGVIGGNYDEPSGR